MATGDLSGFKTYAEWQAANRAAGGTGNSTEVRKHFGQRRYRHPVGTGDPKCSTG
jgi:hypothetical protein